jgi:Holliday junction resolvase
MTARNKIRGNALESEVVKIFRDGCKCTSRRAWGSNGKALGLSEAVDVEVITPDVCLHIQCKRKKKLPDWIQIPKGANCVVCRQDGRPLKYFILFDLQEFITKFCNVGD